MTEISTFSDWAETIVERYSGPAREYLEAPIMQIGLKHLWTAIHGANENDRIGALHLFTRHIVISDNVDVSTMRLRLDCLRDVFYNSNEAERPRALHHLIRNVIAAQLTPATNQAA
jgi:hypothetical protein